MLLKYINQPTIQFACLNSVLYIFKTTFILLEIKSLIIQSTILFVLDTINKMYHQSQPLECIFHLLFCFPCCLIYIQL